ncbi:MAG: hypothetical protein HPY66_0617 [Firmicutes bacterium]|nr:hypothetical protein [Bacillota bacterium]MDI6706803.1 YhcN/YlaJ family sporulation lipoprotein [Bacillota bacterium]
MHKRNILVLLAFVLLVSLAMACAPQQRPEQRQTPAPQQRVTPAPEAPPNRTPERDAAEDTRRAAAIADSVEDINGVKAATVVVSGTTAYVGIDLSGNVEGKMTDAMKQSVIDTAKKTDRMLNNVYVSADVDTVTRLKNFAKDIRQGKPVSGFLDELTEMFRRPAPTVR